MELIGRIIKSGAAEGLALVSPEPIGFLGGVDLETGVVVEDVQGQERLEHGRADVGDDHRPSAAAISV